MQALYNSYSLNNLARSLSIFYSYKSIEIFLLHVQQFFYPICLLVLTSLWTEELSIWIIIKLYGNNHGKVISNAVEMNGYFEGTETSKG